MFFSKAERESQAKNLTQRIKNLLDDVDVMTDYITDTGKELPEDLVEKLAELDCSRSKLCQAEDTCDECMDEYACLMKVHAGLAAKVAPATPTTLRATESPGGSIWVKHGAVNWIVLFTLISLVGMFVFYAWNNYELPAARPERQVGKTADLKTQSGDAATTTTAAVTVTKDQEPVKAVSKADQVRFFLLIFFAAGLGSGFYSLTTSHAYIMQRTYNPQYDQAYYIRYILGLVAGMMLGCFGTQFFDLMQKGSTALPAPVVLAVVGGYAAEAFSQILQRVGETLVTMVSGGEKKEVQRRERAVKAEADLREARNKAKTAKDLQDMAGKLDPQAQQAINDYIRKMT